MPPAVVLTVVASAPVARVNVGVHILDASTHWEEFIFCPTWDDCKENVGGGDNHDDDDNDRHNGSRTWNGIRTAVVACSSSHVQTFDSVRSERKL